VRRAEILPAFASRTYVSFARPGKPSDRNEKLFKNPAGGGGSYRENRAINIPGRSIRLEKLAGKRKIRARADSLLLQWALISINPAAENPSTSRGAAITWPRGTAVISRGASAEGRNAIMCRLYATIIARAHGAERRRNRQRDPINRPRWAPQRVAPVRNRICPCPPLPSLAISLPPLRVLLALVLDAGVCVLLTSLSLSLERDSSPKSPAIRALAT